MAATNYTPIQLYYSTTASAAPTAGNLVNGELAINITDGKLYYKDNGGVVQVIATKGAGTIGGSNTQIQFNDGGALAGNAAMVFNKATNVTTLTTLNLTNALGAAYGGTAQSAYAQGDLLYASAVNTLSKLSIGTVNYILTSTGSVPQWVAPTSVTVQTANNLAGGAAGSVPYQSAADTTAFLAIGAANRVMTSTGSAPQWVTSLTGLTGVSSSSITNTSLTSGRVVYSGASGVQTDSANLTFNGTTLSAGGFSTTGNSTLVKLVTIGDSSFTTSAVLAAATPAKLYIGTGAVTDGTSAGGATNTLGTITAFGQTQVIATNANVTYTNLATLYVAGAPTAGTNVTITNPYAFYVAGGASYFGGAVDFAVTPSYSGGTANGVMYLNASKQITTGSSLTFDGTILTTPRINITNTGTGATFSSSGGSGLRIYGASGTNQWDLYLNGANIRLSDNTGGGVFVVDQGANIQGLTVGRGAGAVATNTAVGSGALAANTTGANNTAFGADTLPSTTSGARNTAVGSSNLRLNISGVDNSALGYGALDGTTGSYNTAVGSYALVSNTTASNNTAVGYQTLYSNQSGSQSLTAVGYQAGYTRNGGSEGFGSVYMGYRAAYGNTTGVDSVYIGGFSGNSSTGSYNTSIGCGSLYSNLGASNNTAVGYQAGYANTTGAENAFFGAYSGKAVTTASYNTAIGTYALGRNETGAFNVAVGRGSVGGLAATVYSASYNTGVGGEALGYNQTGQYNTALGSQSLYSNTTADSNTAVGYQALYSNTTGTLNTAVGMNTLRLNVAGTRSLAVGHNALQGYTASGQADNVAVGLNAMTALASGTANTAVGNYALSSNAASTGSANSAVGTYALQATTSGSSNTAMGFQAGYSLTTGSRNVFIGRNTAFGLSSGSENTVIGPPNGSDNGVGYSLTSGSTNTLLGINAALNLTSGSYNTIVGGYTLPTATTSYAVALADGSGNARFLYLNSTSAQARYASNETMLSYVSANQGGVLRHRNIPVLGNPNGGTYKGYLILAKAYDGVVGQALSNVLGRFIFVRGGTGSGNRSSLFDVNCATAYSVTTVGISGLDQGDYAQRIVTCTYDSEQWLALETSQTGGGPDGGVFFEGTFQDAGMVYVDATYVSLISEFNSSVGLNVTNFGSTLNLNSGQITFPATQNASSNANTLDDYEEGTWTPTFGNSNTNPTVTGYSAQVGWYVKVGRLVTVYCDVEASSITGGVGTAFIRGLPFTAANIGRNYPIPTFRDCNAVASGGANTMLVGFVDNNQDYVYLQFNQINGAYGTTGSTSWNSSGRVTLSVTYYAAN